MGVNFKAKARELPNKPGVYLMRDRSGRVQVVINPEDAEPFAKAKEVRSEFVLRAIGTVAARPAANAAGVPEELGVPEQVALS